MLLYILLQLLLFRSVMWSDMQEYKFNKSNWTHTRVTEEKITYVFICFVNLQTIKRNGCRELLISEIFKYKTGFNKNLKQINLYLESQIKNPENLPGAVVCSSNVS